MEENGSGDEINFYCTRCHEPILIPKNDVSVLNDIKDKRGVLHDFYIAKCPRCNMKLRKYKTRKERKKMLQEREIDPSKPSIGVQARIEKIEDLGDKIIFDGKKFKELINVRVEDFFDKNRRFPDHDEWLEINNECALASMKWSPGSKFCHQLSMGKYFELMREKMDGRFYTKHPDYMKYHEEVLYELYKKHPKATELCLIPSLHPNKKEQDDVYNRLLDLEDAERGELNPTQIPIQQPPQQPMQQQQKDDNGHKDIKQKPKLSSEFEDARKKYCSSCELDYNIQVLLDIYSEHKGMDGVNQTLQDYAEGKITQEEIIPWVIMEVGDGNQKLGEKLVAEGLNKRGY